MITSLNRGQVTCVNERVAGTRHFAVGGQSPVRWNEDGTSVPGTQDHTNIWVSSEWSDGVCRAESYGKVFASDSERTKYLLTHGYIRPYITSPHLRLVRLYKSIGCDSGQARNAIYALDRQTAFMLATQFRRSSQFRKYQAAHRLRELAKA